MDRRESIKSMLIGSLGSGMLVQGCTMPNEEGKEVQNDNSSEYGRTPEEKLRDEQLISEQFFTDNELSTIAILCDIILPVDGDRPSATESGVLSFIEFIAKDLPYHQLPMRGGLMWLDQYANATYNKRFTACSGNQQIQIVDLIAYPNPKDESLLAGVSFFNRLRNLVLTGYYTSQQGIKALGYQGNVPNVWDGVPQDVLDEHGLSYDPVWLSKCIDQSKRNIKAEWDENGNLTT